jgi:hypothetical protein
VERFLGRRENFDKYIFVKSNFAGRDFGDGEKLWEKDLGQIHIYEVSLRGRRETSRAWRDFADEERLRRTYRNIKRKQSGD